MYLSPDIRTIGYTFLRVSYIKCFRTLRPPQRWSIEYLIKYNINLEIFINDSFETLII